MSVRVCLPVCAVFNVFSHEVAVHAYETDRKGVTDECFLYFHGFSDDLMNHLFA